ncbi:MAG TPA: Na+/H+ antiporter NhaA [Chitinophagales bacterium]|nr:Na+/H+ antiporter NhaA [Chitinophagales bacterium]
MKKDNLFTEFFDSEKTGGLLLIVCTILSLVLANTPVQESYLNFWHIEFAEHTIAHWVNDGLMTIFFLLVGLELEREIYAGELSSIKKASLPAFAALGGMLVPAGLFLLLNYGTSTQAGAGIPMATDIAFAIGILALVGNRVPPALKVFLTALAVIDDLGAILIIALFYTSTIVFSNLFISLGIWAVLLVLNRLKVHSVWPYLLGGIGMWYFMLHSGVHATITGVLLAFAIPFGDGTRLSISYKLQHWLHKPVAFVILPLFALANTCIVLEPQWYTGLAMPNSIGIMLGLVVGKPLGIMLFCLAATWLGLGKLPGGVKWKHLMGAGLLAGIGFTMSIFITMLAFDNKGDIEHSKIAVLLSSVVAGVVGFVWLRLATRQTKNAHVKHNKKHR